MSEHGSMSHRDGVPHTDPQGGVCPVPVVVTIPVHPAHSTLRDAVWHPGAAA